MSGQATHALSQHGQQELGTRDGILAGRGRRASNLVNELHKAIAEVQLVVEIREPGRPQRPRQNQGNVRREDRRRLRGDERVRSSPVAERLDGSRYSPREEQRWNDPGDSIWS